MPDLTAAEARFESGEAASTARSCGRDDTVVMQLDAFRTEIVEARQTSSDQRVAPYEQGFAAYASGTALADNPYAGDRCAHMHWANGWSQARDEARRQAR
jgi:hypothetical protein